MKKCQYCSEEIQEDAIKCRFCDEWLNEGVIKNPKKAVSANKDTNNFTTIVTNKSKKSDFVGFLMKLFRGRLGVGDYFLLLLFSFIFYLILITAMLAVMDSAPALELLFFGMGFCVFLLIIAGHIRRVHDIGMSGFWVLIILPLLIFLPFVGLLLCSPFLMAKGVSEVNKYGTRSDQGNFLERVLNLI